MTRTHSAGWIALHRRTLDGFAGCDDETLGFWSRLLLMVNWKAKWFRRLEIGPGQILLTDRRMQDRLYPSSERPPSINTIKKRLESLRAAGMIEIETVHGRNGYRLVSVKKWEKYQLEIASMFDAKPKANRGANLDANAGANRGADRTRKTKIKKSGRNPDSDQMNVTFENALPLAVQAYKALHPKKPNDRQLIARAATLAGTSLSPQWFAESLGGVTRTTTHNHCGKFQTCCRDHATRLHQADFDELASSVSVPRVFYSRLEAALKRPVHGKIQKPPPSTMDMGETAMNDRKVELAAQARNAL